MQCSIGCPCPRSGASDSDATSSASLMPPAASLSSSTEQAYAHARRTSRVARLDAGDPYGVTPDHAHRALGPARRRRAPPLVGGTRRLRSGLLAGVLLRGAR